MCGLTRSGNGKREREILLLLVFVSGANSQTINARVGDSVLLPCIYSAAPLAESTSIYWRDNNNSVVLDIIQKKPDMKNQDQKYGGRVVSFPRLYEAGNFSVQMKNVQKDDSSFYECHIPKVDFQTRVLLQVSGPAVTSRPAGGAAPTQTSFLLTLQAAVMTTISMELQTLAELMDLSLSLLFLLGLSVSAWALESSNVSVRLGENVTFSCSQIQLTDIYWYMEVHSGLRACILRTLSNDVLLYVSAPAHKYSSAERNQLKISNVTAEDGRSYFCARKLNNNITFEERFLLQPVVPVTPRPSPTAAYPSTPPTTGPSPQQLAGPLCENALLMFSSLGLNLLLLLISGVLLTAVCLKRESQRGRDPSPSTCENTETPQYEEIQLPPCTVPPAAPTYDGIYYKAQRPQGHLHTC